MDDIRGAAAGTELDEVHHLVRELSRQGKPVVAVMRSMGASGAYYIAAAADHIVANPLTITGSVGVIIPHFEYSELLDKVGVAYTPYKSGEMKDLLSGGLQRDPEVQRQANEHLREIVDASFRRFAEGVAWGRSGYSNAEEVMAAEFGDGRILSGTQAHELGLVDQLGYFDNALDKARELAGLEEVNVVRYRRPWSLRDLWIMRAGEGDTNLMKIELPNLLDSGQALYYLLPGLL